MTTTFHFMHIILKTCTDQQKFIVNLWCLLYYRQLHIAAVHGCEKSVATLIKVCPERKLLNIVNRFGHTALHLAVLAGQPHITKILVDSGASISIRDFNGDTPFHIAVQRKYMKSLKYLLEPVKKCPWEFVPVLDQKNYTGKFFNFLPS